MLNYGIAIALLGVLVFSVTRTMVEGMVFTGEDFDRKKAKQERIAERKKRKEERRKAIKARIAQLRKLKDEKKKRKAMKQAIFEERARKAMKRNKKR